MHSAIHSKLAGVGVAALGLASGAAQAEVTATFTAASNYDFRGITQSALDPALQASIDWVGENGLYASLWGSNIDFGTYTPTDVYIPPPPLEPDPDPVANVDLNIEIDAILGYAGSFTEDFGYDVGITYYKYLGNDDGGVNDFNYAEVYSGLGYKILGADVAAKVWYSWNYSNSGDSAWYGEGNVESPLPWWDLGATAHFGYSGGNYWTNDDGIDAYYDWSVGLTRSFGRFDFAVKYIDGSDLKEADCSLASVECGGNPTFSSQSTVYVGIATTFPWGKEE